MASAQSLGLLDPLTLAWELIPFSFVVDWFLPVGTYLSQLTALNGLTLMNGFTSYTTDYSVNLSALRTRDQYPNDWFYDTTRQPPAGPFPAKVGFSGSSSRVVHRKQRGGLNLGGATPALPKFKNPLSLTHFLNAMALLAVSFRK